MLTCLVYSYFDLQLQRNNIAGSVNVNGQRMHLVAIFSHGARTPCRLQCVSLDTIRLRVTVVVEGLCGRLRAWAR